MSASISLLDIHMAVNVVLAVLCWLISAAIIVVWACERRQSGFPIAGLPLIALWSAVVGASHLASVVGRVPTHPQLLLDLVEILSVAAVSVWVVWLVRWSSRRMRQWQQSAANGRLSSVNTLFSDVQRREEREWEDWRSRRIRELDRVIQQLARTSASANRQTPPTERAS